jgi:hypothetical protein
MFLCSIAVPRLNDQHRITVTVKPISGGHGGTIRRQHRIATRKRTYKHEQGGSWQVEIRQKSIDDVKCMSRMHE